MSESQYSSFTLNFNRGARPPKEEGDRVPPTMRGSAKVVTGDGSETLFEVAAWGPNPAKTGGPDYYNVTLTPKDPALAARQVNTPFDPASVPNPVHGFTMERLGSGKIFERTEEEIRTAGKNVPKFYGHALVLTKTGVQAVDISAWKRGHEGREFYSGNANLHDPEAAATARSMSGRPARAPTPQNG